MPDRRVITSLVLGTAVGDKSQTFLYRDIGVPLKGEGYSGMALNEGRGRACPKTAFARHRKLMGGE